MRLHRYSGPDFDDRLIQLVRENPAIYDVSHPNYRRNPVRVAIWERIASELGAPSRFLQTKWKNIRYNYLQEVKSHETGVSNPNLRKRRFTEDLSFLQYTAQSYNVKKGTTKTSSYNSSDNESNSFVYPDNQKSNDFDVIEIEHSDDDDDSDQIFDFNACNGDNEKKLNLDESTNEQLAPQKIVNAKIEDDIPDVEEPLKFPSPTRSGNSTPSSPLLTPMIVMGNGNENENESSMCNGEINVPVLANEPKLPRKRVPPSEIMANAAKRKAAPAPFPCLTPINDPIELYCLSLVDSLRSMTRSERERVKFEFAKILKDASYKDQS